jgi:hypothetical protein
MCLFLYLRLNYRKDFNLQKESVLSLSPSAAGNINKKPLGGEHPSRLTRQTATKIYRAGP